MKRIIFSILFVVISLTQIVAQTDSIAYTTSYAKDVYYSLKNGEVKSVVRANWDIAFSTNKMSSSILVNDGSGVELYSYPTGDTASWSTLDTAGITTWSKMYNMESSWEEGAFGIYSSGHPDYGWGVYNMVTHNVVGDSLFVVKTIGGSFKKLWIIKKESALGVYHFRYANLDGSSDTTIVLNSVPYNSKNYIYYDLNGNAALDREPDADSWDILFTKYMGVQPQGGYYSVTGVLSNEGVSIAKVAGIDTSIVNWADFSFSDEKAVIGWDWKTFSMATFTYVVDDSLVNFVTDLNGDVYKLVMTGFAGSSTGKVYFRKQLLSTTSIGQEVTNVEFRLYPNPATNVITIETAEQSTLEVSISDLSGRVVLSEKISAQNPLLNINSLTSGLYILRLSDGIKTSTKKFIVK